MFRRPASSVSRSVPDRSAAYPSSERASTLTPVRWLILSRASPESENAFAVASSAVTAATPMPAILVPIRPG